VKRNASEELTGTSKMTRSSTTAGIKTERGLDSDAITIDHDDEPPVKSASTHIDKRTRSSTTAADRELDSDAITIDHDDDDDEVDDKTDDSGDAATAVLIIGRDGAASDDGEVVAGNVVDVEEEDTRPRPPKGKGRAAESAGSSTTPMNVSPRSVGSAQSQTGQAVAAGLAGRTRHELNRDRLHLPVHPVLSQQTASTSLQTTLAGSRGTLAVSTPPRSARGLLPFNKCPLAKQAEAFPWEFDARALTVLRKLNAGASIADVANFLINTKLDARTVWIVRKWAGRLKERPAKLHYSLQTPEGRKETAKNLYDVDKSKAALTRLATHQDRTIRGQPVFVACQ
jgi:hypothetical protein